MDSRIFGGPVVHARRMLAPNQLERVIIMNASLKRLLEARDRRRARDRRGRRVEARQRPRARVLGQQRAERPGDHLACALKEL